MQLKNTKTVILWCSFIYAKKGEIMATIHTAILIEDRLSQPIRAMHKKLALAESAEA